MPGKLQDALWPKMDRKHWVVLALIVATAVIVRSLRLTELPGGFHTFNEDFYLDLATRMTAQSAFAWFLHPLDVNNPPLYPLLVSWLFRLGAPHVVGARIISVLAGTWTVIATFLLGRQLYDERTGLVASALLALMPGVVLVDHNIQVDPLFVALLMTGLLLYVIAARTGNATSAALAGVALGLSFLTKQAVVVAFPALAVWETWSAGNVNWLAKRRTWVTLAGFAIVGVPWYAAQIFASSISSMFANAASISNTSTSIGYGYDFWVIVLGRELLWMLFPVTAVLAIAGLVRQAIQRAPGDKFVLTMGAGFVLWFVIFHQHTYYLLPVAPFAALAAARALDWLAGFVRPRARAVLIGLLAISMLLGTIFMFAGHKWGFWSPLSLEAPESPTGQVTLFVEPGVNQFAGPLDNVMDPGFTVRSGTVQQYVAHLAQTSDPSLLLAPQVAKSGVALEPTQEFTGYEIRPVLFGFAIAQKPWDLSWTSYFSAASWSAEKVGPLWEFGLDSTPYPSDLYLYDRASFQSPAGQ